MTEEVTSFTDVQDQAQSAFNAAAEDRRAAQELQAATNPLYELCKRLEALPVTEDGLSMRASGHKTRDHGLQHDFYFRIDRSGSKNDGIGGNKMEVDEFKIRATSPKYSSFGPKEITFKSAVRLSSNFVGGNGDFYGVTGDFDTAVSELKAWIVDRAPSVALQLAKQDAQLAINGTTLSSQTAERDQSVLSPIRKLLQKVF